MVADIKRAMLQNLPDLPITDALPEILSTLAEQSNLVLLAPPGAGKTTLVPLALADETWCRPGKIVVLEPRRIAARAAAHRMADLLGESVGQSVGYRVRFDNRIGPDTRIEVVTGGVFIRQLAQNPGLEGISAVLFDEFHERSLDGDLALALCLDLQRGLRDDLRLVPMSATLDGGAVAASMDAAIVRSEGRSFPVEISYRERRPQMPVERAVADAVLDNIRSPGSGSILAFLPGQREIEQTARLLENTLPADILLHRLYGALSHQQQDAAIRPCKQGQRKVVLASAIAETSLTIEGITCVVDSGLSRLPVFEPATGLTRLQTVRSSKASVDQRAGRAGRLAPGQAIRLWRQEQTAALPAENPPEILNADLTELVLTLADWGIVDVTGLQWMDVPPEAPLNEARKLLGDMGALDDGHKITPHGRSLFNIALPPRYAHMVLRAARHSKSAAQDAARLALLLQERGVGGNAIDLEERLAALENARDKRAIQVRRHADELAGRALKSLPDAQAGTAEMELSAGILLGYALSDRIAQRRGQGPHDTIRYRLSNGRGAQIDAANVLARQEFLVVADMAGRAGSAQILSATAIGKGELTQHFGHLIEQGREVSFDPRAKTLSGSVVSKLGALELDKPQRFQPSDQDLVPALLAAVRQHGLALLPWQKSDQNLRHRLDLLHRHLGDPWRDVSETNLIDKLEDWLAPYITGQDLNALADGTLSNALLGYVGHPPRAEIDRLVPSHLDVPSGSKLQLVYQGDKVVLSVRPQELFGLDAHPNILGGAVAVEIELVSPAGRPIQITRDLPGFWRGSWRDVRADLRGRYPKHPWPEDPLSAEATSRAKRRGS